MWLAESRTTWFMRSGPNKRAGLHVSGCNHSDTCRMHTTSERMFDPEAMALSVCSHLLCSIAMFVSH